jgi:hypothetical protein
MPIYIYSDNYIYQKRILMNVPGEDMGMVYLGAYKES